MNWIGNIYELNQAYSSYELNQADFWIFLSPGTSPLTAIFIESMSYPPTADARQTTVTVTVTYDLLNTKVSSPVSRRLNQEFIYSSYNSTSIQVFSVEQIALRPRKNRTKNAYFNSPRRSSILNIMHCAQFMDANFHAHALIKHASSSKWKSTVTTLFCLQQKSRV